MDILSSITQAMYPGYRVPRADGYLEAKKYPMPRDSEAVILDKNPESNYIYMKKVYINGADDFERYRIERDPIPEFTPDKYVTKEDFNKKLEEVMNGIDSIRESLGITESAEQSDRSN